MIFVTNIPDFIADMSDTISDVAKYARERCETEVKKVGFSQHFKIEKAHLNR